jgi:MFS family permease
LEGAITQRTPAPPHTSARRDLGYVFWEGTSWSVMVGIGETYFAAFVLALGMGEVWAGWVTTFPLLVGGFIQLITPYGVNLLGSRKRWVSVCTLIQSAVFLPLVWGAGMGAIPGWAVFAVASLYWASGLGAGPAWNAWMTRLVPRRIRSPFFANRAAATNFGTMAGLLAGGAVLHVAAGLGRPLLGFSIIFAAAAASRLVSTRFITKQTDVPLPPGGEHVVGGWQLARRFLRGRDGRLILYLALMTMTVSIASPFFTPFMLKDLGFTYLEYMVLLGVSFAAKVVALRFLAGAARRWGAPRLVRTGAVGITLVPALWLAGSGFSYLLALQVLAGVSWAAYEFASFLLFFDHIDVKERTSLLTTYNLINGAALVAGSLVGGLLFQALGAGHGAYHVLFAVSCVGRAVLTGALVSFGLTRGPVAEFTFRMVAIRPSWGSLARPLHGSIRHRKGESGRSNGDEGELPPDGDGRENL